MMKGNKMGLKTEELHREAALPEDFYLPGMI